MAGICKAPEQWNIESLPNELLLSIKSYAFTSQSSYRMLVLINRRFHDLVEPDHLPQVPIRLKGSRWVYTIPLDKWYIQAMFANCGRMPQPDFIGVFEVHSL
jgi:hypothetical protein